MKSPLLELFYFDSCPYCQMVLTKINDLKLKVKFQNIMEDSQAKQKLVADTGRKTVPCLYIDSKPMHESSDIIKWLEKNKNILETK